MDGIKLTERQMATRWVAWVMTLMWGMFFAAPTQAQTITALPNPLNFTPAVAQGGASAAQRVTVRNTGTRTMNIGTVIVSGTNATSFTFVNNCGRTLAAGRNCTINVTFRPKAQGALTATLDISTNATNAVAGVTRVTLNGTGAAPLPVLSVTPTSLAFGSVGLNVVSGPRAVVVSNTGQGILTFTQAPSISTQTTGAGFAVSNTTTCGASLAPSSSCIISVTFTPTTTGAKTGTLAIRTNGSPATFNVSLTGTGTTPTPVLALSPTRATLTCSTPYGGPVFTSIAATNTGTAPVTLGTIGFGTGAAYFSQTNTCGGGIAVGSACSIAVKYTPTGRTQRTATMTVNSNGGNRTVSLTGSCRSHPSP
jgi:hypothetical protein